MAKAGYTGEQPVRVAREESYPGAWTSPEQYAERKANTWSLSPVYQIERSVRLNSADSAFLSRTPASAGNRRTWTFATWIKGPFNATDFPRVLNVEGPSAGYRTTLRFTSGSLIEAYSYDGSSFQWQLTSSQVFRDPSAWFHLVLAVDTTQATSSNRVKLYINGVQVTAFSTANYPSLNFDTAVNHTSPHTIGGGQALSAYLADVFLIDGQALTPTSFGKFDTNNVWQPKKYSGPTPTGNSFWLPFSDNSAATATALGKDGFLLGNNWMPNNLQASSGQNYASWFSPPMPNALLAFDASTTTTPTFPTGTTFTWTVPASVNLTVTSSLDILTQRGSSNGTGVRVYYTDGTNQYQSTGSGTSIDITLSFTQLKRISYIEFTETLGGTGRIRAVVLNGTQLIDYGSTDDSLVDSPTNYGTDTGAGGEVRGNYCTWNPLEEYSTANVTLSDGNLLVRSTLSFSSPGGTISTATSGKWYWEVSIPVVTAGGAAVVGFKRPGIKTIDYPGANLDSYGYRSTAVRQANGSPGVSYGSTWTTSDIIGVAIDADAGTATFYKNGVSQGVAFAGLSGSFTPHVGGLNSVDNLTFALNAGQRPFAYPAPSGFKALCTQNLPTPTITKPNTVMDVALYTGNGSTQTISGINITSSTPDLIWIARRDGINLNSNIILDSVRGILNRTLSSHAVSAETIASVLAGISTNALGTSLTLDVNSSTNASGGSYVAWIWQAGGSAVTNTSGTISSQVNANPNTGFSVVTYTGTGANATVGHGLGVAPEFLIIKKRSANDSWRVYHRSITASNFLSLDQTDASTSSSVYWNSTAPTSTVFSLGTNGSVNGSSSTFVGYCWAPVAGYSSFGSYTGNGSTDGPFVYTGFRPAWLMIKQTTSASTTNWLIMDNRRQGYNVDNDALLANGTDAESTTDSLDITSNGFKLRSTVAGVNASNGTYIYACFAESPFALARAR